MARRGPQPTPTALKLLRGNPGNKKINRAEPKPAAGCAIPPMVKSDKRALAEWKRLEPMLLRLRVLTEADSIALGNLCLDVSLLERAQRKLADDGLLYVVPATKHVQQNPILRVVSQTSDRVMRQLREFGLTPASRTAIQALPATEADDPWSELMA